MLQVVYCAAPLLDIVPAGTMRLRENLSKIMSFEGAEGIIFENQDFGILFIYINGIF